ncbi:MAG TPA: patatin-like phospholipase family protein, partial [Stellaceae bacterium]|nr:patatin-like phospholipase family protein [Stellaceae bacterium]
GWAHIGVLRALEDAGITPDIVAGTSIGALIGGVYLGGHLADLETWALRLNKVKLSRMFDFQFARSGVIAGRRVLQVIPAELTNVMVEDLPAAFVCVATDLATGHEVWLRSGPMIEAIRASYAVPGLFPPVKIDDRWLIDGALANPVPVSVCRAMGAHVTIAVNLNGEAFGESPLADTLDFPETDGAEDRDGEAIAPPPRAGLVRQFFRRGHGGPSVFAVMARSLHIVQDRISRSRLAGDPPDVMIFPRLGDIGILEFHRARESIAAGEAAAAAAVPRIKELVRRLENGKAPWDQKRRNTRERPSPS